MSLQRTAVNNSVTTALVFIAIAIFGVFSLMNLSINQLPDMETNFIMVMTSYQGASAQDIETNISKTLENTLNAVPDLKHISSTSKENTSVISLEFESGIDIETATNNVRDKLDIVRNYLPDGCTNPVLFKFNAEDMPIMLLSVTAEESLPALEKIIDDRITTPLARVSGVGTVSASGAPKREIQVYVDPNKLESYNLALETISTTLMNENRNIPAGYLDIGSNSYNIRIQKEFGSAKEMEDVIVGSFNGAPIYLRDIARVVDGPEERSQESYSNGVQGATITIQKQTDANAVNVIKGIKKKLNEIEKNLPSDVKVTIIVDGSTSIISTISSLRDTIFITFLLVMLVVFVFLGRWRATFIIVLAIPISLLASLIYLYETGNTLNIISMSALSLAIGMVVDDAIVVLENITTHIEKGEKVVQETRRWDDNKSYSYAMRSKEDAQDYKYFPDPDLMPIEISEEYLENIRANMPELADAKRERYINELGLPEYDAGIITGSTSLVKVFEKTVEVCKAGLLDGFCYAPVNRKAVRLSGELFGNKKRFLEIEFNVETRSREINVSGGVQFARVTSHIPLSCVSTSLTIENVFETIMFLNKSLLGTGVGSPRIAVSELNPHNGESGTCGLEEMEIIEPAIIRAKEAGIDVSGPYAPDVAIEKALYGHQFDGVVNMYHDQSQIALKASGLNDGATLIGGMPIPITTSIRGTAYDIAGKNMADTKAFENAIELCSKLAKQKVH